MGCGDDEDNKPFATPGSSSAGTSAGGKGGSGTAGGPDDGGTNQGGSNTAGTGLQSGSGGTGGMAGTDAGGTAGTGGAPTCATNCNDNNPCTDDACEADNVCVHRDNTATCDDANACTSGDTCSAGACTGTNNTDACDDANECTSDDACLNGACTGTNNTDACDDANECTSDDACLNGTCTGTNNTDACDDLSTCTSADQCWNGACRGTLDVALCPLCDVAGNQIQNCDFSDGMTHWLAGFFDGGAGTTVVINERLVTDITNGAAQNYTVQPRQEPLSLKQGMKYRLRMVAGASVDRSFVISLTLAVAPYTIFTPGDTDFGYTLNVTEQMQPYEFEFIVTEPDNDNVKLEIKLGGPAGNPSVVYIDDVYLAEVPCTGNPDCNDDNDCTDDVCTVGSGICANTVRTGTCTDDGNVCTSDECVAGTCTHAALDNDTACTSDADDCTADVCTGGQCTHEFDTNVCDCQLDEHCDDTNPCTDDSCDMGTCVYANNAAACDDDDVCTSGDVCAGGVCEGVDASIACDADVCTIQSACLGGAEACSPASNVCFDCTVGGNLLTNCDLSNGATGWLEGWFGGTGTQSVVNGLLQIEITNGGTEVWQVQPRQEGLMLVQGTTYVVRFNAYASIDRPMIISLTQNGGGFASYSGQRVFNLTTEMQEFTFEFTMNAAPPAENVKLEILLGDETQNPTVPNTVYFDNLFVGPKP